MEETQQYMFIFNAIDIAQQMCLKIIQLQMLLEILPLDYGATFVESIAQYEYHTHTSYVSTRYETNDELRTPIQQR